MQITLIIALGHNVRMVTKEEFARVMFSSFGKTPELTRMAILEWRFQIDGVYSLKFDFINPGHFSCFEDFFSSNLCPDEFALMSTFSYGGHECKIVPSTTVLKLLNALLDEQSENPRLSAEIRQMAFG